MLAPRCSWLLCWWCNSGPTSPAKETDLWVIKHTALLKQNGTVDVNKFLNSPFPPFCISAFITEASLLPFPTRRQHQAFHWEVLAFLFPCISWIQASVKAGVWYRLKILCVCFQFVFSLDFYEDCKIKELAGRWQGRVSISQLLV